MATFLTAPRSRNDNCLSIKKQYINLGKYENLISSNSSDPIYREIREDLNLNDKHNAKFNAILEKAAKKLGIELTSDDA